MIALGLSGCAALVFRGKLGRGIGTLVFTCAIPMVVWITQTVSIPWALAGPMILIGIGLKPNPPDIRSAARQAEATMPELTGLDMSGGSHATITGFSSAQALEVDLSGGSHLQGDIAADNVTFDLAGSSEVILISSARNVMIDASGGSEVDLADFSVVDASVDLSSSSEATVNPSGRLDVDASGFSHVTYLGSPTPGKMDTSGSLSIEQK